MPNECNQTPVAQSLWVSWKSPLLGIRITEMKQKSHISHADGAPLSCLGSKGKQQPKALGWGCRMVVKPGLPSPSLFFFVSKTAISVGIPSHTPDVPSIHH